MKRQQGVFRYLAVLLPCLLAVGCGSLVSSSSAAPIKIGLILPLTSGVGGAAQSAREGTELAIEEANGNNGVRGRRLALVTLDDGGAPDVAARHVDQLAGEQVVAIVGPLTDAATIGAAGAAERHQVVIISPGATAPIPFGGSFVFRTAPPVRTLGGAMAGFLVDTLHLRRIAIVHDSNEYGTMAARAFEHAVTARLAAVSSRRLYRDGEVDFTRHVRGALVEQVQAVFVAGYPDEAAVLLQQLRAVAPRLVVAGSDALHSDDLLARAGAAANGLYVPTGFAADARLPIVRAFVTKYQQKHNRPPDQFAAQAYDAVRVIAQAMRVSGVDRQKVRQAVATLKRYPGVTGTLTFDRWGDPGGEVTISRVNGGVFVSVNP